MKLLMLFFIAVLLHSCSGCKPKPQCISAGGGKGGNATITVTPFHEEKYVDSCTIYIKYGTLDAPPNDVYDDSQKCVKIDTIPTATFRGLKEGLYYFCGKGYHTYAGTYVIGGKPYTLCGQSTQSLLLQTSKWNR